MSSPAITIESSYPGSAALHLMNAKEIRRLPVLRDRTLVGIITKSDLVRFLGPASSRGKRPAKTLEEIMTPDPATVAPGDTVETAARLLLRKKYSGLPVVEDGKVCGVITESDLFRALCRMLGIDGRGARIEVSLPDDRSLVEYLSHHLGNFELLNLVTVPQPRDGGWKLVLRVKGRVPAEASP
jgi:acetoin utilization protein AcuB